MQQANPELDARYAASHHPGRPCDDRCEGTRHYVHDPLWCTCVRRSALGEYVPCHLHDVGAQKE